ncbi:MAG: DEAD/DEAH box helicase [Bacteroidales bacterium]
MKSFEELGVAPELLKAVGELGFEAPMPVQEAVIPYLLTEKSDIVALAQTGTGKTAAFGIPVIQKIDISQRQPQALILSPTRELCLQIASDLADFSKYVKGLKVLPVYGGSSIESQIRSLRDGVHIIVATPGRLIDLINRGTVKLDKVRQLILDEADEMLNMGFTESIDEILKSVPEERSTLLFSATMPAEIARIAKKYMKEAKEITIGNKNESSASVRHTYFMVHAKDKYLALKRIADYYPQIYGIVFCRTRKETQEIADALIKDGYNADSLHGELSQQQRDYVMQKFRIRNLQLLVATDVAARGLDVSDLTHVINYGLPDDIETYTHRSGRTGRAGKTGQSIAIIHVREKGKLKSIEKIINKTFEKAEVPNAVRITEKQLFNLVDKLEKVAVNESEIAPYLESVYRRLDWLSKEDVIKRLVSLEFNRMIEYYRDAGEIEVVSEGRQSGESRDRDRDRDKSNRQSQEGFTRMFINVGKTDGLFPNVLIEMINRNVGGRVEIGKIDLMKSFSFFDVENREVKEVIRGLSGYKFKGRVIAVDVATEGQTAVSRSFKNDDRRKDGESGRKKEGESGRRERPDRPDRNDRKDRGSFASRRSESSAQSGLPNRAERRKARFTEKDEAASFERFMGEPSKNDWKSLIDDYNSGERPAKKGKK